MLRIQRSANGEVVFKLSGRLDKDHIVELEILIGAEAKVAASFSTSRI